MTTITPTATRTNPHRAGTKAADRWQDREDARDRLRAILRPGMTVYGEVRHVSSSGMVRDITLKVAQVDDDGHPYLLDITGMYRRATGDKASPRDGWSIRVGGSGMNMVFATVYGLGRTLYPDGVPCTGHAHKGKRGALGCRSNDHVNGDRTYRRGKLHRDGGYAFDYSY